MALTKEEVLRAVASAKEPTRPQAVPLSHRAREARMGSERLTWREAAMAGPWNLVPIDVVPEMRQAAVKAAGEEAVFDCDVEDIYHAMIAAAPPPPAQRLEAIANAIRTRRRELIAQPLDRIYGELALAALKAMQGGDDAK